MGVRLTFRAHDSCIYTLMLTPDGSVLVSGSATEIRFWRWADIVAHVSGGGAEPVPMSQIDPGCETNGKITSACQTLPEDRVSRQRPAVGRWC